MAKQIRVLTRNLYLGADLLPVAEAAIAGDEGAVVTKASEFWKQVQDSDFPARAEAFASEIARKNPHLVGLQEVSLYRTGELNGELASNVQIDFLQILLDELERQGVFYKAVSIHEAFDGQLPAVLNSGEIGALRLTDRDVILVRSDLPSRALKIKNSRTGSYESQLDVVTGLDVSRGWTSVDVIYRGEPLRFVNTHLETDQPKIQKEQVDELIDGPAKGRKTTLLVGDFNSDAENKRSAAYSSYKTLAQSYLVDAWTELRPKSSKSKSVTYGANDDLRLDPYSVDPQRLDLILFGQGLSPLSIERFITRVNGSTATGPLWNSDHGGVSAEFLFI